MMYGETFDDLGVPVDALKYYSWLAIVGSALATTLSVSAEVVVADLAVSVNKLDDWGATKISDMAAHQAQVITAFASLCNTAVKPRPLLMSSIATRPEFQHRRHVAERLLHANADFYEAVAGSVRPDHLEDERKAGFRYSLDEVALISAYNVKVGPPREQFYDRAARVLNAAEGTPVLLSVLLTPTYPLAVKPGEFVKSRELREFGVTAYKAGSLGFGQNRLVIGRDDSSSAEKLLSQTKIIRRIGAPNAVAELAQVLQLVQWAIDGAPPKVWLSREWEERRLNDDDLRREAVMLYHEYVDSAVAPALARLPFGQELRLAPGPYRRSS